MGRVILLSTIIVFSSLAQARDSVQSSTWWFEFFNQENPYRWTCSDGWSNNWPFQVGWRADHVDYQDGALSLTLDNDACPDGCSGMPYVSAECKTWDTHSYGFYFARLKAARGDGLVTSFFLYTGPTEQPSTSHQEIDVEILGKDPTKLLVNSWVNGIEAGSMAVPLGFDASEDFHDYIIYWRQDRIHWYVDGKLVATSFNKVPDIPMHVFVNMWAADTGTGFYGDYRHTRAVRAFYDLILYIPR